MSDTLDISDDDDSISLLQPLGLQMLTETVDTVVLSSDEDTVDNSAASASNLTSDEEDNPPQVNLKSKEHRQNVIKQLFPSSFKTGTANSASYIPEPARSVRPLPQIPRVPGIDKMIGGVTVNMPVEPYGCQIALMSKVITAIKTGKNCLLESPTGSGKTLALLCSALAWQSSERARVGMLLAEQKAEQVTELKALDGAVEYVGSAPHVNFSRSKFGDRSIYDSPVKNDSASSKTKRSQDLEDANESGLVKLNEKRRRLNPNGSPLSGEGSKTSSPSKMSTPQKPIGSPKAETPENVSTPTVYYGSRTHKQLQQVIKEFKRTAYCGEAKMTVLASRDYSCVRELDRSIWNSKNDMCRGCTKTADRPKGESNCKYYDNRMALHHDSLPPAFDLEELVEAGKNRNACPYYAARAMATSAHIVFCPYNYLIEPSIRSSMKIELKDNVVIIDEAHNIEDICRDAASFSVTKDQIQNALSELEKVSGYLYSGQEVSAQVDHILKTLKTWNEWFLNQVPLVNNKPVNNGEAVHTWQAADFVTTLENHNLGKSHCVEFKRNASAFCQRLRENPKVLFGVTQSTATLVESIDTALTYLFRCDGVFMDDFKPALVRTLVTAPSEPNSWRRSHFNQRIQKESLELRLMCMNPAIVFEALKEAKCIILASGTLTPLISLHSELGTDFPLKVAPNHVISSDRVWVGTLSTCPDGSRLECKSNATSQAHVQDALGAVVLWVCRVTPHGVLCFMPSYQLMNRLATRWQETGVWKELEELKTVFMESRNTRDHNDNMEDYYRAVESGHGAVLFAVFRGKVSEGMDFRDHQARAVITIGIPYPNTYDMAVKEKMNYNNKYEKQRNLLSSSEWLRVQAYRALNQAVGRCVRHRADWGAVLMVDARFTNPYYTEHLSKWVRNFLNNNHHTFESLVNSTNSMESFMKHMTIRETEDDN